MYLTRNVLISKKLMKYDEISEDLIRFGSMKMITSFLRLPFFFGILLGQRKNAQMGQFTEPQLVRWLEARSRSFDGHLVGFLLVIFAGDSMKLNVSFLKMGDCQVTICTIIKP